MKKLLVPALLAAVCASTATAQTTSTPSARPVATAMDAPIDPQRLAAARIVIAKLVPEGIYRQLMGSVMGGMTDNMVGMVGKMPLASIARAVGVEQSTLDAIGETQLREIMEIYDPNWERRTKLGMDAMMGEMIDLLERFEPRMREAMSRAYAAEFTTAELQALQGFFATPAGAHYAQKSLAIAMSPEIVKATNELMPEMMAKMPDMVARAMAATKDIPPPRTLKDLSDAERIRLAGLLGIDPATLVAGDDGTSGGLPPK